jgi:hypothetical protein
VRIPAMPLTAPSKALRVFFCFSCVLPFSAIKSGYR